MGQTFRECDICGVVYPAGTWQAHSRTHFPPAKVMALLAEGYSQAEIARRLGTSRQQVHRIVKREAA